MARNPFIDTKLEYELEPVLWFSKRSRRIAQRGKSTFVSGTRGSGKTSILRSLSTRYISEISSLNEQLSTHKFEWFGVYIRLQDAFADVINSPIIRENDKFDNPRRKDLNFTVFSQYIELLILSALTKDLVNLRQSGFVKFSAGSEFDAIQRLLSSTDALKNYAAGRQIETLNDLDRLCRQTLDRLFSAAIGVSSRVPIDVLQPSMPGEIIAAAAKCLLPMIRGDRFKQGKKLVLKLMIDDCEILSPDHQAYLNTLIRNTSEPVSWVIAFVGTLYDGRRTIRPNQMLSDADREIEFLDESSESEFRELCTRIASLRLYRAIEPATRHKAGVTNPHNCFDLERRLGKPSLNTLIDVTFEGSISPEIEALRTRARAWQVALDAGSLGNDLKVDFEIPDGALPYTVAIAAEHLGITPEEAAQELQDPKLKRRLQQKLARKQRAAFLVLGRERKTRMILAGSGIVLGLSDSCIRDFLDIMRSIFEAEVGEPSEGKIVKFVKATTPIASRRQSAAIYSSAEAKLRSVMTIADPYGEGVTRLVDALGQLTAEMHTGEGAIRNPEMGIFRLNWRQTRATLKKLDKPGRDLDELFRKSELDGFVREVDPVDRVMSRPQPDLSEYRLFRLHRRFAPAFGFSFRGPYGVAPLPESAFVEVIVAEAAFSTTEWVRRTLSRSDSLAAPNQMQLPGLVGDDD